MYPPTKALLVPQPTLGPHTHFVSVRFIYASDTPLYAGTFSMDSRPYHGVVGRGIRYCHYSRHRYI